MKPVRNRTAGGLRGSDTIGLVLHVQAGNGELSGWFNNPAARASSTWWAGKAGGREQYGNPDTDKFWAQEAGNPLYHSIETEGQPSEPLTPEQIETCAVAYAFGHVRYGWPFRLAEKPGQPGLGWHGMGGAAWGGHTGCPGDKRKAQRAHILARAQAIVGGEDEDMPTLNEIAEAVWHCKINNPVTGKPAEALAFVQSINSNAYQARLDAAVARALAEAQAKAGKPLTQADIDDIAKGVVKELGDGVEFVLTPKEK